MTISFETIYKEFEDTRNICSFCEEYKANAVATRFLLIRSLDKKNLQDIIRRYSKKLENGKVQELTKKVFSSPITIPQLLSYIEKQSPALIKSREEELNKLPQILSDFPITNCGVRNDKIDDIVKNVVRNKSINSRQALEDIIDHSALPRIRQYILWSYYNQNSNDIIELFFLRHPRVIPTLRKIHDIDFFIKIDNEIVPFDLKFTHISDEYFDMYSKGIIDCTSDDSLFDEYHMEDGESELEMIKSFYSAHKKEWNLPNYGKKNKAELLDAITKTGRSEAQDFYCQCIANRKKYVRETMENLHPLEWWNYKYQGERLFCNNNRLFVFLAYRDRFIDGSPLKGKTEEIGKKITKMLDSISSDKIHTTHYHYDKDAGLAGDYTARSISTIYTK